MVASRHSRPWRLQLNVAAVLVYLYNPLRFLVSLVRPKSSRYLVDAAMQLTGIWGLTRTLPKMTGWALRLMCGKVQRQNRPPVSALPTTSSAHEPVLTRSIP